MSFDAIAHLDFTPDPGTGLRDRALVAYESTKRETTHKLLTFAQRHINEVLDVSNAANVRVITKDDKDGDGEVYCEVDGMDFRVTITYPRGGADEPSLVKLAVKTGNNWSDVPDLRTLGSHVAQGIVWTKEEAS